MLRLSALGFCFLLCGCEYDPMVNPAGGLVVDIDDSFQTDFSQTNISIKALDKSIYCIPKNEINRIFAEYSPDNDTAGKIDIQDISVRYLKSVNINEPIYFVDQVGLNFYVDKVKDPISIIYYRCEDLIDPESNDDSTRLSVEVKAG